MATTQTATTRDVYAEAASRLGRPLTYAEHHIDIVQLDRDLAAGKRRLHAAIDREKRRAINAHFRYRKPIRLRVTAKMQQVLRGLYRTGQAHARREIRSLTGTRLAQQHTDEAKLTGLVKKLRGHLNVYQRTVTERVAEAETAITIGEVAEIAMVRQVLQIPGALNVASQMVSGAMFSGLGSVFEENSGLFSGFAWSAIMDDATCDPCAEGDGTEYATWEEAMVDLPDGGPAEDCDGEGRCRCRLVPLV
jgi:hypothetical protein